MYYPVNVKPMSQNQGQKLLHGGSIRVQHGQGETLHLTEQQIKKLLKSFNKGKASTIQFDPYQAQMHGGKLKIGKAFKNLGSAIKQDTKSIVKTVGSKTSDISRDLAREARRALRTGAETVYDKALDPTRRALAGRKAINTYKKIGLHAIEQGIPIVTTLGSMAMGDVSGLSGAAAGSLAAEYAGDAYRKKVMGQGLFKSLHKMGIKGVKKPLMKGLRDTARISAQVGSQAVGSAIGAYTGNPMIGQKFAEMSNSVAQNAINGNFKKGLKEAGKMTLRDAKRQAKRFAVEAVDDMIDKNLSGNQKRMAENILAGKFPDASDLVRDVSNMYTGTDFSGGALSLRRKRGRPRKQGGALYPA